MTRILIMYSTDPPTREHLARLSALQGVVSVDAAGSEAQAVALAAQSDIFLGHRYLRQCLPAANRLRWVQSTAGGIDHLISDDLLGRAPLLTRCPIFCDVIAAHAVMLMQALIRRLPDAMRAAQRGAWGRPLDMLPPPRRATVVGQGAIGLEINRALKVLGIEVTGIVRQARATPPGCDHLLTTDHWRDALPRTDALFLAIPGHASNRHFVDAAALAQLPPHAVVINVGRGCTIDTQALLRMLRAGDLGGAGLDVVDPAPAADDPIWNTPRLIMTPKVASMTPNRQERLEAFVESQVRCYLAGEAPLHSVDLNVVPTLERCAS